MSTGIVVTHPWLSGATATTVVPAVVLTPAATRTQFQLLIGLRQALTNVKAEQPILAFAADQIRALLGTSNAGLSADAVNKLTNAIAAEEKRRDDQERARRQLTRAVERLLRDFERDHPREALDVWELYLDYIKKQNAAAATLDDEIKQTETKIKKLRAAAKKKV